MRRRGGRRGKWTTMAATTVRAVNTFAGAREALQRIADHETRAALRYVWEHSGGDDRWEEKTRHKVRAALDGDPDPSDVLRFA